MIRVGTHGFAHAEWMGPFYPLGTGRADLLSHYARSFTTVEIAPGRVGAPAAAELEAAVEATPADFRFSLVLPPSITGEGRAEQLAPFLRGLAPVIEAGKCACLLAEMPPTFQNRPENKAFLLRLRERTAELPLAVEFNHKDWIIEGTEGWLGSNDIGYCCVDQPRLPELVQPVVWYTGAVAYVRLKGRNYAGWSDTATRYDHAYDLMELAEWLPKLEDLARQSPQVLIYALNHVRAQSVETARNLKRLLAVG